MTNPFFEALLNSPEFHEELGKMRQWVQDQLFRPGGVVPHDESDRIAWSPPSSTPEYSAIAHSEEEMFNLEKVPGDVIYRADLDQAFLFVGDDSPHPSSYFRVLRLDSQFQANLHEATMQARIQALEPTFGLPQQMFGEPDLSALPSSMGQPTLLQKSVVKESGSSGRSPRSIQLPPCTTRRIVKAPEPEKGLSFSGSIFPPSCKFFSGTRLLRCAVNPCAKTCEGCADFEPKIQNQEYI